MPNVRSPEFVPCDADAPRACTEDTPNGWVTRPWRPGEKEAYKRHVLMKPNVERVPYVFASTKKQKFTD